MKICLRLLLILPLSLSPAIAQQPNDYDYFQANRTMIRNGAQALITCNGMFTSKRSLEQVFDQELNIIDGFLRENRTQLDFHAGIGFAENRDDLCLGES